jgi:hypothetical protein
MSQAVPQPMPQSVPQHALPPRSNALARWPYWRWVLLVATPLVAALALTFQSQRDAKSAQALTQEAAQLQARTALVLKNAASSPGTQGTPQGFKTEFPAYALRLERLQDFLARLAQLGNATPPTSYRQTALGDSGLVAYQVNLATTTSYTAWRDLVDDVLWADPALSLTSLSLNRSDANAAQVRVQAVFSFYMQGPDLAAPNAPRTPSTPSAPSAARPAARPSGSDCAGGPGAARH